MALFKSTILAQVSGSVNGITFSHNAGGSYMRNRSIPVNPGTDRQDVVRTSMTSISNAWKYVLTPAQRIAWRAFGANIQVKNRLGDTITLSGIAAFNRVNLFRLATLGTTMLDDPPTPTITDAAPAFDTFTAANPVPPPNFVQATITLAGGTPADYSIAAYLSGAISPGIKFYRGPYPDLQIISPAAASNYITSTIIPAGTNGNMAGRFTLYHTASGTPIWTVNTDATTIAP